MSGMTEARTTRMVAARVTAYLLVFTAAVNRAAAQDDESGGRDSRVSGIVREAGAGTPVPDARVLIVERKLRTLAGRDGRFAFEGVPPGEYTVRVSRIGYAVAVTRIVVDSPDLHIDITLTPAAVRLSEIVVTPGHFGVMDAAVTQQQTLTRDDLQTVPQIGEDVFRVLRTIPGVASDDISTRLNVRGGSDQELLVLFDGMELYEPYHLKDFDAVLGIVDVQSIGGIDLITGGFPVQYGDKLTGVFDMQSRTPPADGARTSLGLSIMNASIMSQGGFGGGRGQWLFQARRGYLDIILELTGSNDPDEELSPRYYDIFGKLQYQLNPSHRLSVNVLHAGDDLTFRDSNTGVVESGWASSYGWLAWDAQLSDRVSTRTMGFGGRVTRRREGNLDEPGRIRGPERLAVDDDRRFRFAGVKQDVQIQLADRAMLKLGGEVKGVGAEYDYFSASRRVVLDPTGEIATRQDTISLNLDPRK